VDKLCRNVNDHIVTVYRHDKLPNSPYYFIDMELCDMNLEEYMYRERSPDREMLQLQSSLPLALDIRMIWNIMRDITNDVAFIHNHMEVHRDIKPTNSIRPLFLFSDCEFYILLEIKPRRLRTLVSPQKGRRVQWCQLKIQEELQVIEHQNLWLKFQPLAIMSIFGGWDAFIMSLSLKRKRLLMTDLCVNMLREGGGLSCH